MSNSTNVRLGKSPAKRPSKQEAELQRRRALQVIELAREAERRRNGLGAVPVRTEKPSSPARSTPLNPRRKRPKKVKDARGGSVPSAKNRSGARVPTPPVKIAPAYMRLTPEEAQRERRIRERRAKSEAERRAKKAAQAAKKPGTAMPGRAAKSR